jgi:predicted ester cyclase
MRICIRSTAAAVAFLSSAAAAETVAVCPGQEARLARFLEMHTVLFEQRDGSRVAEFYNDPVVNHNLDSGGAATSKVPLANMTAMWAESKKSTPDRTLTNDLILCQGDYVVARTTMRGTPQGRFFGQETGGRSFTVTSIDIYRFDENGKVAERWGNTDSVALMRQLGINLIAPPKAE